jgi:pilus assembly protein CpaB
MMRASWNNDRRFGFLVLVVSRLFPLLLLFLVLCLALDGFEGQASAEAHHKPRLMLAVVLNRDVVAGTRLDYDAVAKIDMPSSLVTESMVLPSRFEKIMGRRLLVPCKRGDILLYQYFEANESIQRLSDVVRPGGRIVSLPVSMAAGVGGHLRPKDRVDILFTGEDPKDGKSKTRLLASNVLVMAAGDISALKSTALLDLSRADRSTVSVFLTPKEAERAVWAAQNGNLYFLLRDKNSGDSPEIGTIGLESLLDEARLSELQSKRTVVVLEEKK